MIFNISYIIIILCLIPNFLFSQHNTITGQILDFNNNPIEFVTINIKTQENTLINSNLSKEDGRFNIEEKDGYYFLEILYLGDTIFRNNILLNKNIDLGIIKTNSQVSLQEVKIFKKRKLIEKKIDRLVFNVDNSVAATGGDLLDVLKITPRIKVQNDEISMTGKNGMSITINDKITNLTGNDLINYLKTIKSDEIKSIEVIANPPSKYSAEGNSGIINIITKKIKQDLWNISIRSNYQQSTYATGSGGIGFNFKKNKLTLSSNLNYINGLNATTENNTINYPNTIWEQKNKRKDFNKSFSTRLGLDYEISNKFSTGFIYNYSHNTPEIMDNVTSTLVNPETNTLNSLIITKAKNQRKRNINNFNYHFVYDIDSLGRKLSFDFDFLNFKLKSDRVFQTNTYNNDISYESVYNKGLQKINNYSFNLDMEHPFNWGALNYGGKLSYINTNNDFKYYNLTNGTPIFDSSKSNEFKYKENTQAFYFSIQRKIAEKWEAKIGLRLENTLIKGNSVSLNQINNSNYTKLFPTAYLSFIPNDNHSFSLNYSRRINRPSYRFLNPFKWIISPYSYSEGNPYLQPSFSNNIEFEYVFKDNYISNLYFSQIDDGFEQMTILNSETNIQQIIPSNFIINKTFGLSQTVILNPLNWITINLFGNLYYSDTSSKIPVTLNYLKGWNADFSISNDFILNKKNNLAFNISYNYTAKGVNNLDYNTSYNQLNTSLKALFFNKKLSVSFSVNDLFSSNRPTYTTYSNNIKNSFRNYYDNRFFRLSMIYSFGKSFKINNKNAKNKDEVNRIE